MTWTKDFLREITSLVPPHKGSHAFIYDNPSDRLMLILNLETGFRPVGFDDHEFAKDPKVVAQELKTLLEKNPR